MSRAFLVLNSKPSLYMSSGAVNRIKKLEVGSPLAKFVLFYLADCATQKGCFPSQRLIAKETEISEASVKRILKNLEERGFIARRFEMIGNKIKRTWYELLDGVTVNPSDGVTLNGSHRPIVSPRTLDGVTVNPSIYKEVLNDKLTTNRGAAGGIESVADELAIEATEKAFKIRLDLETKQRIRKAIIPSLIHLWPQYVNGRAVGWTSKSDDEKLKRIGYALTDFLKENKPDSRQAKSARNGFLH